jgi:hypothetical protein
MLSPLLSTDFDPPVYWRRIVGIRTSMAMMALLLESDRNPG